jgi:hypothetical protein
VGVASPGCTRPLLVRDDDGLRAVAHAEHREDPRYVRLHGCVADDKLCSDVAVRLAAGDQAQYFELPWGQLRERFGAQ